ncbi:regulatory protein RecX [Sphingobacterium sp. HJSM2_6]|uniref:regulatory protein RecX n=1 Tax=Sphingobacterium sp. HJSM2_6 TaxID=3366264 RepID=UPI003BC98942
MEEESRKLKRFTPNEAKRKAEAFCAYQERAQQEVRDKLYFWGLHEADVENIISYLIEENYLNEERFAKAYVLGKFRIKGWGKIKIIYHLKQKKVSKPLINIAVSQIDEEDYSKMIHEIIAKKIKKPLKSISAIEKNKLLSFLQSKGYENELIFKIFKEN